MTGLRRTCERRTNTTLRPRAGRQQKQCAHESAAAPKSPMSEKTASLSATNSTRMNARQSLAVSWRRVTGPLQIGQHGLCSTAEVMQTLRLVSTNIRAQATETSTALGTRAQKGQRAYRSTKR